MDDRLIVEPAGTSPAVRRAILDRARRRGFRRFALGSRDQIRLRAGEAAYRRTPSGFVAVAGARPRTVPIVRPRSPTELDHAVTRVRRDGAVALDWDADRIIPLENALARRTPSLVLWVVAHRLSEVPGALGALEHGADSVVVPLHSEDEVDRLEGVAGTHVLPPLNWALAPIRSVRPVGVGDRVLVDTTRILAPDDGLLVGSRAACLFHVASEAVGSTFSGPRAFRVNAGSAHSYVLMADGTTRYLAELSPGDRVLIARPRGRLESVHVGRVKIERRPLVLVETETGGTRSTVFLQEAETVRLSTPRGQVPSTELSRGDRVYVVSLPAARHLGTVVDETIEER